MPTRLSDKAAFAVEFIDLPEAAQVDGARWEAYQIAFLNNQTRFGIDLKARQVGWSFTAAVDAVVDGILNPGMTYIFVSINLDEAKEKIRYARQVLDALDLPPSSRPTIQSGRDSKTEFELDNGSRYISHPCRAPRGKPNARIYLDEMAHYHASLEREIYRGALPATTRGNGYMRIGSSPLGAGGLFWEIYTEAVRAYPGYTGNRRSIPWWEVGALCRDVEAAQKTAPEIPTADRVSEFGTRALVEIFENMFLEDFQQEYECSWVDEAVAWISWELIKRNQQAELLCHRARSVDEALQVIPAVEEDIRQGRIEGVLAGGIDVGRRRNLTEFIAVGKTTTGQLPVRLMVSLDRVEFDDQERCLREVINRLPFVQVLIDQNGLGMHLAENLEGTGRAQGVTFTNATKELWAVEARVQAERGGVPIPMDRDLAYQIHSIKKKITAAKNAVFDTQGNEKHHADKFWAWALALWAARSGDEPTYVW